MTRLRTAKLAGVKGERREIEIATNLGPSRVTLAVCYGQWAIHRHVFVAGGYTVTHTPTGYSAESGPVLEDSARRLVAGLLAVREFKTTRAKAATEHCREVYRAWKRGL